VGFKHTLDAVAVIDGDGMLLTRDGVQMNKDIPINPPPTSDVELISKNSVVVGKVMVNFVVGRIIPKGKIGDK